MQRIKVTIVKTIATEDATAVIHPATLHVYARRLAVRLALSTVLALTLVEIYHEPRQTAQIA